MNEDCFARFQFGIVEQHVFAGAEGYRRNGSCNVGQAFRRAHNIAGRHVGQFLGIAIQMKSVNALWMFAMIVTAFAAGAANAAGRCAIDGNQITGFQTGYARSDGSDFSRCFRANGHGQLAFGKCHAAPAPYINMVEGNHLDFQLNFTFARRRWRRNIGNFDFTVRNKLKSAQRFLSLD